eukprot:jgi/Chrzof1/2268/Cz11g09080.t1
MVFVLSAKLRVSRCCTASAARHHGPVPRPQLKPAATARSCIACKALDAAPDEAGEIPGNYLDAMTSNTKLGKAVKAATEELEHLNSMVGLNI